MPLSHSIDGGMKIEECPLCAKIVFITCGGQMGQEDGNGVAANASCISINQINRDGSNFLFAETD